MIHDVDGVNVRGKFVQTLATHESVGDHDVFQAVLMGEPGCVLHQLEKNGRLGIRI